MPKSATDVIQDALVAAVLDAVMAFKEASKGLPNALLRDLSAVHPNTTLADLPAPVQAAVAKSVRDAFVQLRREGYTVAESASVAPPRPRPTTPSGPPRGPRPSRPAGPPIVEERRPRRPGAPKRPTR